MKEDKEAYQQLVKRLARFLGLEVVEKRIPGFKKHIALQDQYWKNIVEIRGYPANYLSWKVALCKFLGAECFQVFAEPEENCPEAEVLQVGNPFFDMLPEVARLRLDLLAPEKKKKKEKNSERRRS